jgi:large subunit ribosomal protein L10
MVSEKKKAALQMVSEDLEKYPVIGILDMHKLPGKQLHEIRNKLREKAKIKMVKKRIIILALKEKKLQDLEKYIQGEPALLLSNEDPFKLAKVISESKSKARAKAGDVAPMDIIVKEGPTPLPPGPVIGELQKVKIPAGVEGEKIVVKKDTVVAKEGDVMEKAVTDIITKLGIEPMEVGLNLLAALQDGTVYSKDVLFVPPDHYMNEIKSAVSQAFNLSIYINYFTKENIPLLLSKAHREAEALALKADITSPATIKALLVKSKSQAKALEQMK